MVLRLNFRSNSSRTVEYMYGTGKGWKKEATKQAIKVSIKSICVFIALQRSLTMTTQLFIRNIQLFSIFK